MPVSNMGGIGVPVADPSNYRRLNKIPQPLDGFSKLDFRTTKRLPKSNDEFSESSRRDDPMPLFSAPPLAVLQSTTSFENRSWRCGILCGLWFYYGCYTLPSFLAILCVEEC